MRRTPQLLVTTKSEYRGGDANRKVYSPRQPRQPREKSEIKTTALDLLTTAYSVSDCLGRIGTIAKVGRCYLAYTTEDWTPPERFEFSDDNDAGIARKMAINWLLNGGIELC